MGQAVVLVVNLKLLLESRHWNLPLVLSIVFSVLSFTVFTIFMQVPSYTCSFLPHLLTNSPLLQVFPFDNFLVDNTYYMIYVGLMGDLR